jgi:hypothetical protein
MQLQIVIGLLELDSDYIKSCNCSIYAPDWFITLGWWENGGKITLALKK